MANLTGGQYITFTKPYLEKVADIIESGEKLNVSGTSQVINKTPEIKQFLKAVKTKNESAIGRLLKNGTAFTTIFNGWKWNDIDKSQFTSSSKSDAKTTQMQEPASLFAIQKGIENNGYRDQKDFYKKFRDDLLKIYPDMNEEWENTFFQQQLTVVNELGNTRFDHYSRDDGFMEWISNFAKSKYGISKKDSWNPADIWLVNNITSVKNTLKEKIIDNVTTIEMFNAILRDMWHERKVIGISLKKMSGNVAKWELVNVEDLDIFDSNEYHFKLESINCSLTLKDKNTFSSSDSKINIASSNQKVMFQIRQNSAGFNNLKIEGTDLSAKSARLGKAPLDMVRKGFDMFNITFDNDNKKFPTNEKEFNSQYDYWKGIFNKIKKYTGITTEKQFKENMTKVFKSDRPDYANSKLMQMKMIAEMLKLDQKNMNDLLTNLAYISQKKGKMFGPFGKLY